MTLGPTGRFAARFISSRLTPLLILFSLLLGTFATWMTPREEEPQIVVPMVDIFVGMAGATPTEIESRLIRPLEKFLWEIPGVEYLYSTSREENGMVIVRFRVGEDLEKSLTRINEKLEHHKDLIPPGTIGPIIKNRTIDDVPVMAVTFWSDRHDANDIRRIAAQAGDELKSIPDVSELTLIGGQPRAFRIEADPARLELFNLSLNELIHPLLAGNRSRDIGALTRDDRRILLAVGGFFQSTRDLENLVVSRRGSSPVYLREVARVTDGHLETTNHVAIRFGPASSRSFPSGKESYPAVTLAIAKRAGTNAITLTQAIRQRLEKIAVRLFPEGVHYEVTRDYGLTSAAKSHELLYHMALATLSVSLLIFVSLGFRESLIVAIAIPVTLALTLLSFYLLGYTLNRITLFALIFSIGILVDDAIVVVENMVRHLRSQSGNSGSAESIALAAVDEVGNPTILATATVIAAILPMAFVGGLMGPYMSPIPIGASLAMLFSLAVAFIVTPWLALRILPATPIANSDHGGGSSALYRSIMSPLLHNPFWRKTFLAGLVIILALALAFVPLKLVKIKMLPFDNKGDFQLILDFPEGTPLENGISCCEELANFLAAQPEIGEIISYAGTSSPYNFNGLVRHYFLRQAPHGCELQVNLADPHKRTEQSHPIARRLRPQLQEIARRHHGNLKVSEVPPGPPVLQTIVAEIYSDDYQRAESLGREMQNLIASAPGVVDVDSYLEQPQAKITFSPDPEKGGLFGIARGDLIDFLATGVGGYRAGLLRLPEEIEDVPLVLEFPRTLRENPEALLNLAIKSPQGSFLPLREFVTPRHHFTAPPIFHKNLRRVVYVTADVAGAEESPVYPILNLIPEVTRSLRGGDGLPLTQWHTRLPDELSGDHLKWDGEWHITYEVFRDLGLAFGVVMIFIYILVVAWFQDFLTPLTIMLPIPLTLVGILPAHWFLGAFFTATSMIGFIAGAGIIVRNSIILVDFIELKLKEGLPLDEAVIEAGAVRFRPMLLTAAAVVAGAGVMLFDPIFQGLAISLIAGEVASTLLARLAVPVLYFMEKSKLGVLR